MRVGRIKKERGSRTRFYVNDDDDDEETRDPGNRRVASL